MSQNHLSPLIPEKKAAWGHLFNIFPKKCLSNPPLPPLLKGGINGGLNIFISCGDGISLQGLKDQPQLKARFRVLVWVDKRVDPEQNLLGPLWCHNLCTYSIPSRPINCFRHCQQRHRKTAVRSQIIFSFNIPLPPEERLRAEGHLHIH